jgi:hypothetical protein
LGPTQIKPLPVAGWLPARAKDAREGLGYSPITFTSLRLAFDLHRGEAVQPIAAAR